MEEVQHILNLLKEVKLALERKEYLTIKQLSDKVIHNSSINQDPDVVSVAVIIYALSKLIERESYKKERNWNSFYNSYLHNLNGMIYSLEKKDIEKFRGEIEMNRKLIQNLSGDLKFFIGDVFRRAMINKASKIYEHGISMEKTARILGISIWELAEYAGGTRTGDINLSVTLPVRQRIKYVEDIFKK